MSNAQEIITRAFKAILSTKHEIKLDPDEVPLVKRAVETGNPVQTRNGIINPSYLVAIVEDVSRETQYAPGPRDESKRLGIRPLKDIFADPSRPALPSPGLDPGGGGGGRALQGPPNIP